MKIFYEMESQIDETAIPVISTNMNFNGNWKDVDRIPGKLFTISHKLTIKRKY